MVKVLVNSKTGKKGVDAELIKENTSTIVVRLPDGNVITRKKKRDLITN